MITMFVMLMDVYVFDLFMYLPNGDAHQCEDVCLGFHMERFRLFYEMT